MKRILNHILIALLAMFLPTAITACSDKNTPVGEANLSIQKDGADVSSLDFNGNSSYQMIAIRSNVDFEMNVDQDWCQLSNHSGSATTTDYQIMWLKVAVDKNETSSARSAVLTVKAGNEQKTVNIRQNGLLAADDYGFEVAKMALQNMGNGLNIGNTLDANGDWITSTDPKDFETAWGNPQITPQLIAAYKAAGVKALRLPVTWRQHIDEDGNFTSQAWVNRVREVVDYIIGEGMYCIINVHHDTGGSESAWLRADQDDDNLAKIEHKFKGLWTNIAQEFQGYDDKLIFEGYNEMLDGKLAWTETDDAGYAALNRLAQDFVDAVRATGGNNAHRNLIVNTYGADGHEKSLNAFVVPTDVIDNHLIVEIHNYTPGEFVSPETAEAAKPWGDNYAKELDETFDWLNERFVSKGIPVLIGEMGCDGNVPEAEQVKYTTHFVEKAKALGVPCFYWFDLINRADNTWTLPQVRDALLK